MLRDSGINGKRARFARFRQKHETSYNKYYVAFDVGCNAGSIHVPGRVWIG